MSLESISKSHQVYVEGASTEHQKPNDLSATSLSASSAEIEDLAGLKWAVAIINRELGYHKAAYKELYGSSYRELSLADNPSSEEIADVKSRVHRIEESLGWVHYQTLPKNRYIPNDRTEDERRVREWLAKKNPGKVVDERSVQFWLDTMQEAKSGGCGFAI